MNKLSRRSFISLSSLGMAFGITDRGLKIRVKHSLSADNPILPTLNKGANPSKNRVIHLHPQDNVAVALENLSEGTMVSIDNLLFVLAGSVTAKHKFTLSDIPSGEPIYLYGIKVGTAVRGYKCRNYN